MRLLVKIAAVSVGLLLLAACGTPSAAPKTNPPPKGPPLPWRSTTASKLINGDFLVADSHNNRIILLNPQGKIVWQFPKAGTQANLPFFHPDDAFFSPDYKEIITNEEDNFTVAIIDFKTEKIVWEYGTPGTPGHGPGQLDNPDDAFLLPGSNVITVADIKNQRILFIDRKTKQIIKQYGQTKVYAHNPPTTYAAPNGDFPAPGGGMLVTEIGGSHVDLLTKTGQLVYTLNLTGMAYPSDANFTPDGNIIVADFTTPGKIEEVSTSGQVIWSYGPASGNGELNHPSLAFMMKNGLVVANDDDNNRVIVIDPKTDQIVWQYGHTGVPGSGPGYLNDPDGMDLLPAGVIPGQ